jgi:hemolysin III
MTKTRSTERPQTRGEEIANALSHGLACALAIALLPILVRQSYRLGSAADVVAASLFCSTMILLYLVSTLYHALPAGRAKAWFNRFDHAAIFVFIAGSYTPFALGVLNGGWGWTLFGLVWAIAAFGFTAKLFNRLRHPIASTGLYVAMGWLVLIAAVPLVERVSSAGLAWLVAGGLFYTGGAIVFHFDSRLRYGHFAWHLLVMAGSGCHFAAAFWHAR